MSSSSPSCTMWVGSRRSRTSLPSTSRASRKESTTFATGSSLPAETSANTRLTRSEVAPAGPYPPDIILVSHSSDRHTSSRRVGSSLSVPSTNLQRLPATTRAWSGSKPKSTKMVCAWRAPSPFQVEPPSCPSMNVYQSCKLVGCACWQLSRNARSFALVRRTDSFPAASSMASSASLLTIFLRTDSQALLMTNASRRNVAAPRQMGISGSWSMRSMSLTTASVVCGPKTGML
mmetsp:Transcript_11431/g.37797  ORF Transcript_11431/g.37797 Transcript_11431/m.37797 type:complete len:233 (+) Transcript_11431:1936-2634(+)|eukprot:scaffold3072_cov116-Isochrysis_galbana.AAC.3